MTLRLARVPWSMCHFRTSRAAPARERLMATRTNATPQKEEVPKNEGPETPPDSPPLNLSDAAVKKLIRSAKKRGYGAHDQINSVLPSEEVNSEQIEGVLADETEVIEPDGRRQRNGKDESTEAEMQNEVGEIVELKRPAPAKGKSSGLSARTDDPLRTYLREMDSVELLSPEGEFAKAMPAPVIGPDGQPIVAAPTGATPFKGAPERGHVGNGGEQGEAGEAALGEGDFDDDDMENSLSLAAIEAELKPKVVETFDNIADAYKRLRRLQDQDIQNKLRNDSLSPAQERRYKKLKDDIISEVKSLRLNQARIDALVEQLYDINKRLVGYEGRLMRLSESHGVAREDFLRNYQGSELDPRWLNRVSKLSAKGWKSLVARDKDKGKQHRHQIQVLAGETGLEIGEFRKIVHMVQKGEREAHQAKKEMVEANLRLVISIAKKYTNRRLQFLDLIQEGNIGLMKAVDKFEYRRGYKFAAYATWRISQAVTPGISDQGGT